MSVRHLILDRDGVLNREPPTGFVGSQNDWEWESNALAGLRMLSSMGIHLSVVTNQSCIGRGWISQPAVGDVHRRMMEEAERAGVRFAAVFVCPHAPNENCECRKPKPALLLLAIAQSMIAPSQTLVVGDAERDVVAGRAAGVDVALVRTGKGRATEKHLPLVPAYDDLLILASALLDPTRKSVTGRC